MNTTTFTPTQDFIAEYMTPQVICGRHAFEAIFGLLELEEQASP